MDVNVRNDGWECLRGEERMMELILSWEKHLKWRNGEKKMGLKWPTGGENTISQIRLTGSDNFENILKIREKIEKKYPEA